MLAGFQPALPDSCRLQAPPPGGTGRVAAQLSESRIQTITQIARIGAYDQCNPFICVDP